MNEQQFIKLSVVLLLIAATSTAAEPFISPLAAAIAGSSNTDDSSTDENEIDPARALDDLQQGISDLLETYFPKIEGRGLDSLGTEDLAEAARQYNELNQQLEEVAQFFRDPKWKSQLDLAILRDAAGKIKEFRVYLVFAAAVEGTRNARTLLEAGDLRGASKYALQAATRFESIFAKDTVQYLECLEVRTSIATGQYKFREAVELCRRALALTEQHANSVTNTAAFQDFLTCRLAYSYRRLGDYKQSQALYQKVLDRLADTRESYSRLQSLALASMGGLYVDMGDYDRALPLLRKARSTLERAGEIDDLYVHCLMELGRLNRLLGNYSESEVQLVKALNVAAKDRPKATVLISEAAFELAESLLIQDRYDKAIQLFEYSLKVRDHLLGKDHKIAVATRYRLSEARSAAGRPEIQLLPDFNKTPASGRQ